MYVVCAHIHTCVLAIVYILQRGIFTPSFADVPKCSVYHCVDLDEVDQELLGQFGVPRSRPCELPALGFTDPKHYAAFSPLSREFACKLHQVFTGQSHLERNGWITK